MHPVGPTVDLPDDDPFLELEEINGARAMSWVEAQNTKTQNRFGDAQHEADAAALLALFDRPDRIAHVRRRGGMLYNFWKDAKNPRGLIRRTTMESYRTESPQWETVLDIDVLAIAENEDWIAHGTATLPTNSRMSILGLSRGGSDACVHREFDRQTKSFVDGGFTLPEAKGDVSWLDEHSILVNSAYGGPEFETESGYSRTVRLWKRGEPVEQARVIFETDRKNMAVSGSVDHRHRDKPVYIMEQIDFFNMVVYDIVNGGQPRRFDAPTDAWVAFDNDTMVVKPRTSVELSGFRYKADCLYVISRDAFLAGERNFTCLYEPGPRQALQQFQFVNGKILVHHKDNLKPRFDLWKWQDGVWVRDVLPQLPEVGEVDLFPLDAEDYDCNGDLLLQTNDPLTPPALSFLSAGTITAQLLKQAPGMFNSEGLTVARHEALAADGERIPYVQIGPSTRDGHEPVYMTGYGGFGMSEEAQYNPVLGKLWLERGGTVVVTHLRGGGEFGTAWHDAGRRENKAVSHDDFAAIATDLVKRGVTVPSRIAAEGGSNGGLLMANLLVRHPEKFGALFCTIPLTDMRRYTKLLAGASWVAEYGDPDNPAEWEFIKDFSAYHLAEPGKDYPPILIATTKADDRVHPGHARKFAAKLQALGYDASFYEPQTGGHGYGKDNKEQAEFMALGHHFLRKEIGFV